MSSHTPQSRISATLVRIADVVGRPRTAAILLGLCLALQLAWPLATMPLRVSWDYGEGWNAYWAARAMAGAPLYTGAGSAITNNYPPLSFYIFGLVGRLAGDQILGGRILSLASLAACATMTGMAVSRLGARRGWAVASGATFLLYVASFAWRYIGSDDPQWLAAAFTLAALVLLCRAKPPSALRLIGASLLLVIGGLVKHNQLAAPIAITVWLAVCNRRGLAIWLASGALFAGLALLALYARFGPLLFEQVLQHQRVFKATYGMNAAESLSGLLPMVGPGLALAMWARRSGGVAARPILLILLFAGVALVLGILERFGTGVSANAHFDTAIGFTIAAGAAFGRPGIMPSRLRPRMAALVLFPFLVATLVAVPLTVTRFAALADTRVRWNRAIDLVRHAPGPVACELPAYCYWAGRPFLLDFYNYGQKLRKTGDPAGLHAAIEHRAFAMMIMVHDRRFREGDGRLPDSYGAAVARAYRPAMVLPDNALLLRPRQGR